MLAGKKIAVLGVGTLGAALVDGLIKSGVVQPAQIFGTVSGAKAIKAVQEKLGIEVTADNAKAVAEADVVILCVKPQNMENVLAKIKRVVKKNTLVISAAASVPIAYIEERLEPGIPVMRVMPNTCMLVGAGMTGLACGSNCREEDKQLAQTIFESVGKVVYLDEKLFNALTALSASGPAYLYVVIESLAEAGVKLGMPREMATILAAQTMLGTGKMILETGAHPALLKDAVTTPAGCTIDGLMELEEGKLRVTLIRAVVQAATRAATRAKEL